jgi:L-threonylcarbamoyladenylate synthase
MSKNFLQIIQNDAVIAAPTDTVYGVIANAASEKAVEAIYALKARPAKKPFQVLVNSLEMAEELAEFSTNARAIANLYWPGGLTLVLPLKPNAPIAKNVTGALITVGLRWPKREEITQLISELGHPLVASSVNTAGEMPLTTAEAIHEEFPSLPLMQGQAGQTASTIVELRGDQLILYREGDIKESQLREAIS